MRRDDGSPPSDRASSSASRTFPDAPDGRASFSTLSTARRSLEAATSTCGWVAARTTVASEFSGRSASVSRASPTAAAQPDGCTSVACMLADASSNSTAWNGLSPIRSMNGRASATVSSASRIS